MYPEYKKFNIYESKLEFLQNNTDIIKNCIYLSLEYHDNEIEEFLQKLGFIYYENIFVNINRTNMIFNSL